MDSFLNICELSGQERKIISPLREIEMNSMTEEANAARKVNDLLVLVFIGESLKLYQKVKSFPERDGKLLKPKNWKIIYIGNIGL